MKKLTTAMDHDSAENDKKMRDEEFLSYIYEKYQRYKFVLGIALSLFAFSVTFSIIISINFYNTRNEFNDFRVTYSERIEVFNSHVVSSNEKADSMQERIDEIHVNTRRWAERVEVPF